MPSVKKASSTAPKASNTTTRKRTTAKASSDNTVTVTFSRTKEPKGSGGVRFDAEKGSAISAVWLRQEEDKQLGNPATLVGEFRAG